MSWPTVNEIKAHILDVTGSATSLTDATISMYFDAFKTEFESEIGYTVLTNTATKLFTGSNKNFLHIGPVQGITELSFKYPGVAFIIPGTYYDIVNNNTVVLKVAYNSLNPYFRIEHFPAQYNLIEIEGTWGISDNLPNDIKITCLNYFLAVQEELKGSIGTPGQSGAPIKALIHSDREIHFAPGSPNFSALSKYTLPKLIQKYKKLNPKNKIDITYNY